MPTSPIPCAPSAAVGRAGARSAPGRTPLWGGLIAFAAMFAYSWLGDHFQYVTDDAGIFLRYAERIAAGRGFGYNDGEAVNGCSSPLFVAVEAGLLRLGLEPATIVLLIASTCLAAAAGVLFETFARFYSFGAAVFGVVALVAFDMPFDTVVDGMETPIVLLLAVLLFRALHGGWLATGLVLGCLVANKLDGALAAVAFAAVHVAARRGFPWRSAACALLVATPMAALLAARFGSLLPNSLTVKLVTHSGYWAMRHLWMHNMLRLGEFQILYWSAWLSLAWVPLARDLGRRFAIAVVQLWFVLHMVVFASVNLGGPYPWYATVPMILAVILATFLAHVAACAVVERAPRWRLVLDPERRPRRALPVAIAVVAALVFVGRRTIAVRAQAPTAAHSVARYTSENLGRQAAGAWLRAHTDGTELLATFEGLPAFEYGGPCYDFSLLNSQDDPERLRAAAYAISGPLPLGEIPAPQRDERTLVATFQYDAASSPYLVYARPDSQAIARGARHFVLPVAVVPTGAESARLEPQGNTWRLAAGAGARLEVAAPGPPTLLLTPDLARGRAPASAGDSALLTIRCGGVELARRDLRAGAAPEPLLLAAPAERADGRYVFELEWSAIGAAPGPELVLREVTARLGEPLAAADFKLLDERCRARIEHCSARGLPYREFGR